MAESGSDGNVIARIYRMQENKPLMDFALMIEGQMGLNWPRWQRLARAAEEYGYAGLFRSDHFTEPEGPVQDALEMWTSMTWLASHTERIDFGAIVSPVSFRDPVMTAWTGLAIDDLSGGRYRLGLGAGWQEREHHHFGYDLLPVKERFARFTEALEVVTLLVRADGPVSFEGEYYQLRDALLLPRPTRPGGPPIVIGGNGPKRTLPLAARFANEWNGVFLTPDGFRERSTLLDTMLEDQGRSSDSLKRTLMTRVLFGKDEAATAAKMAATPDLDKLRERGCLVGTTAEIQAQARAFEAAGVERIMLQWFDDLDDIEGIAALAKALIPAA